MSDAPDTQIDRYHLVRRLGSGAFGTVYLARDVFLEEDVAVKMPLREHPDLMSFLQEPRMLNRVKNPNIVAFRDIERIQGVLCLVMEYVGGGSLRDRMGVFGRGNALPKKFAVSIARGVLRALDSAHSLGVLHRDIKPDNVLVTEDGDPKVTDFGIARIVAATGGIDHTMQPGGTIVYMSPEALKGEISRGADLWATAAMLYEMLTGRLAFPGPSTAELVNQIMFGTPLPIRVANPEIDPELADLVHKALSKDPSHRFANAGEFEKALAAEESRCTLEIPLPARPAEAPESRRVSADSAQKTEKHVALVAADTPVEELPAFIERVRLLLHDHPADPTYHRLLAVALHRLERDSEAYDEFERAFLLDRTDRQAAEGLADLGLRLRRAQRTAEALQALVEIDPDNASYLRRLAMALEQDGDRARAISFMKRSLEIEPDQARMKRILKRWESGAGAE